MDSEYGLVSEELVFDAGDLQMVFEVAGHIIVFESLKMSTGHDAGCDGARSVIHEFVQQIGLAGED